MIHPKYWENYVDRTYDIGMLKLEQPVKFNKFIRPIPLSNVASSQVESCSLAGWSEGDNGLNASYWGPNTVLRKLNFLTGKIEYDGGLHYNESKAHGVNKGDSGTAVICQAGNQTVIQGVLRKSNFDFETGLFRVYFADIYVLMSWIDGTFEHIETLRMYHEELDYYRRISFTVKRSDEDLKQMIGDSTGYQVSTKFHTILMFPQRNRSEFINLWFRLNISEKIHIGDYRFGVQGTFGFSTENSVYDCTVICYLENRNGSCSYVAGLNRCYFSDAISYKNKFFLRIKQSVNIRIGDVKDRDLSEAELFMGNKVPTLNIIGQNDDFGPMMWNVSVTTKGSARYHCEGLLRSTNGVVYDDLDLSEECLQYFKAMNGSLSEYVNVRVLHLPTGLDLKGHLKGVAKNLKLQLSKPLPIPRGFPLLIGHKSQKPTLRQYDPYNGAFYTGAFGCPWMAILHDYLTCARCPVLLIDVQYSFGKSDYKQRSTKLALMAKTCGQKVKESIVVTTYKIDQSTNIHSQEGAIEHSISNEVGITVAYLGWNVEFNDFVQPIALPVGRGNISMADLSLAIVAIVVRYTFEKNEMIYQIPVKIHGYETIDGVEMVTTERLYKAADTPDHLSVELGQGVLVGFEKSIRQHFVIGLNATTVHKSGHQHIERHILIERHTEWIRRTIPDIRKIYNAISD